MRPRKSKEGAEVSYQIVHLHDFYFKFQTEGPPVAFVVHVKNTSGTVFENLLGRRLGGLRNDQDDGTQDGRNESTR